MESECATTVPEGVTTGLREQLALALRSIQWSYAIFWSISSQNPGVLEWSDGYYNGEIKTRKTVQTAEVNADQMGLQRSEQLRELYESLLVGEVNPQPRRPSAALSPEDLTDAEWYYLVCMSFAFNIGQDLPGRTLSKNQTVWLCNAHQAESKTFSRSLLAKSASIQTVVCFPCLGGVIELGVTQQVSEDLNLVERIKASFLEIPCLTVSKVTSVIPELVRCDAKFENGLADTDLNPLVDGEEVIACSPHDSSNGFGGNQMVADHYAVEGADRDASRVQSWHFLDEELSNHLHNSVSSSDSISQSYPTPENKYLLSNGEKLHNDSPHDTRVCNLKETNPFSTQGEDIHYQSVLSTLLKTSHQLILGPHFTKGISESSFRSWKDASLCFRAPKVGTRQKLLKKVLFEVAKLHNGSVTLPVKDNSNSKDILPREIDENHILSEGNRREKLNEKFRILGSLVPTNHKADKLSVLDDTIEYLKELERRVQELESCKELGLKSRTPHDAAERTSDNYGATNRRGIGKKRQSKKRKAHDTEDTKPDTDRSHSSTDDVAVSVVDKDIWIEMRFPWREGVLIEIVAVIKNLHLDSDAIQSTNSGGILSVSIKSKPKGSKAPSAEVIRHALQKIVHGS